MVLASHGQSDATEKILVSTGGDDYLILPVVLRCSLAVSSLTVSSVGYVQGTARSIRH